MRKSTNRFVLSAVTLAILSVGWPQSPLHADESQAQTKERNMNPTQKPITGNEPLGDLRMPEQALAQFYKAFNSRDLKMIDRNFSDSSEVAIDNPLGGIRRGSDQPHLMYEKIFKSDADLHVEFWDYTITQVGDVFWAVGRERGTYLTSGKRADINIRTTRLFRKVDGIWRQIHHHGSIDDADALKAFQARFR